MLTFKTISGSMYEVDQKNNRIRRMYGTVEPTERQGQDGEWKEYSEITPIELGRAIIIVWAKVMEDGMPVFKTTMTSAVMAINC